MPKTRTRLPRNARKDRRELERWIGSRSLEAAAAELGCSQTHLSNFLLGKREFSLGTIKRVAKVAKIPQRVFVQAKVNAVAVKVDAVA